MLTPIRVATKGREPGPAGSAKGRGAGGGEGELERAEQKRLFILVDTKAYPRQVVLGELFELSQARTNEWRPRLLPVLREAVPARGVRPERTGAHFARAERRKREAAAYRIAGTARRRHRPKKPAKQALPSRGKKKLPSDKTVRIVHPRSQRVGYLSATYAGKTQDKQVAEGDQIVYPRQARRHKDTGFQGYAPPRCNTPPSQKKAARLRTARP